MRARWELTLVLGGLLAAMVGALGASGPGAGDRDVLRTVLTGLRHRDATVPLATGVWTRIQTYYPSAPAPASRPAPAPTVAIAQVVQFAQTATGSWKDWYQHSQGYTQDWAVPPDAAEVYYYDGTRAYRDIREPGAVERDVVVRLPDTAVERGDFLGCLLSLRGGGGVYAEIIESHAPRLVGEDDVEGLSCYVVEYGPKEALERVWICPDKQYVCLRVSREFTGERPGEYVEVARKLRDFGGVAIAVASSALDRRRAADGTEVVTMREIAEFPSLTTCAGDGYAEALRRAILPLGATWQSPATDESGEIGNVREITELLMDRARVDETVKKYDAVTLSDDAT